MIRVLRFGGWFVAIGMCLSLAAGPARAEEFTTPAERSDYRRTATFDESVDYFQRLEKASDLVKVTQFGTSPQGRALHLVIVSRDRAFTPEAAKKTGKVLFLIQNSIHAGEMDGTDACLALVRDIVITKERAALLDSVILLIIPIFNVDGHENTIRYTRPNQGGPENAGFRATAQFLNLNRDYMKADAPEMRAWLGMWLEWMPDIFVDDHISDGADWQYPICYNVPIHPNTPETIREWTRTLFNPDVKSQVEKAGFKTFPYAFLRGTTLQGGVSTFVDSPRLSTGYTMLWNRPGILLEMHSLKDFRTRVLGNHAFLVAMLNNLNHNAGSLKRAIATADSQTASGLTEPYPLSFRPDGDSVMIDFAGYEYDTAHSMATDGRYPKYRHDKPRVWRIPYFGTFKPRVTVVPPRAYLIPREWDEQINRLRVHGIRLDSLLQPLTAKVELTYLDSLKWSTSPYEGRMQPRYRCVVHDTMVTFPAGTIVVDLRQPGAKVAIQALEPQGYDSWAAWGFWNTIFERKEYIEDYVIDPLADSMLAADAELKADFESRLKSDTAFAKDVDARRRYFYERSHFAETQVNWYPVVRLMGALPPVAPLTPR